MHGVEPLEPMPVNPGVEATSPRHFDIGHRLPGVAYPVWKIGCTVGHRRHHFGNRKAKMRRRRKAVDRGELVVNQPEAELEVDERDAHWRMANKRFEQPLVHG